MNPGRPADGDVDADDDADADADADLEAMALQIITLHYFIFILYASIPRRRPPLNSTFLSYDQSKNRHIFTKELREKSQRDAGNTAPVPYKRSIWTWKTSATLSYITMTYCAPIIGHRRLRQITWPLFSCDRTAPYLHESFEAVLVRGDPIDWQRMADSRDCKCRGAGQLLKLSLTW